VNEKIGAPQQPARCAGDFGLDTVAQIVVELLDRGADDRLHACAACEDPGEFEIVVAQ